MLEELGDLKYNDLEDLVYRMQLTYNEIIDKFDLKNIPTKRTGYSLKPNIYQISDINKTLKYVLPEKLKKSVTIDGQILKSILKINQTLIFTNKCLFLYYTGFYSITFLSSRRYRWFLSIDCGIIKKREAD